MFTEVEHSASYEGVYNTQSIYLIKLFVIIGVGDSLGIVLFLVYRGLFIIMV